MIPLEKLVQEAKRAAELSYSPYSKFKVGACVEVDGDMWYSGTNIENASYGLTICAERVAIVKAGSHGHTKLKRVIVYGPSQQVRTGPCGACRQFIKEFADDETRIHGVCANPDATKVWTMEQLLPDCFGPENLLRRQQEQKTEVVSTRDELSDCRFCGQFPCPDHAAYYKKAKEFLDNFERKNCKSCRGRGHYEDEFGMDGYCDCPAGKHLRDKEFREEKSR